MNCLRCTQGGWVVGVLLLVGGLTRALPAEADNLRLGDFFELRADDGDGTVECVEHGQIDINHTLVVEWDEVDLRAALSDADAPDAPAILTERRRLETLRDLVAEFLEAQAALALHISLGAPTATTPPEIAAASAAFSRESEQAINALHEHVKSLRAAGHATAAQRLENAANDAVLEDYAALAEVMRDEIRRLGERVRRALETADRYSIRMRARLVQTTGSRRLHLVGYDEITPAGFNEVPRFQLDLNERARMEVEAAEQLGQVVERAMSGELRAEIEMALEELEAELGSLAETLEVDVLEGNLESALDEIEASGEGGAESLIEQGKALLDTLEALTLDVPPMEAENDAQLLLAIVGQVTSELQATIQALRSLPTLVAAVISQTESTLEELPGVLRQDTAEALQASLARLQEDEAISDLIQTFEEVRTSFGFARDIADAALDAAAETPRDVLDESLDTRLELLQEGERNSGELVVLEAELSRETDDGSRIETRALRRVRLRQFGPYVGPRGSLLFTDPEADALSDQSWEPAPALSYMMHWGWRGRGHHFWNDVLDPGLGITFLILDHNDEDDFELGIAASLSLFRSLLWVGYGRNLQAESDFVHVGINPLALGTLWRERSAP